MSDNNEYVRIAHACYPEEKWVEMDNAMYEAGSNTKKGLILYNGEIGWAQCSDGKYRFKIGNGVSRWANLDYWDETRYCHNILLLDPKSSGTQNIRVNFFFINNKNSSYAPSIPDSTTSEQWDEYFQTLVNDTPSGIAIHGFYKTGNKHYIPFRIKQKTTADGKKTYVFQATEFDHNGFANFNCATNLTFSDTVYAI